MNYNARMKRLYRSQKGVLGGVLAGCAEYFEQDPVLWRLGFIVLLLLTGLMPFVLVYLIAWVIIPLRPKIEPFEHTQMHE
jgi:phage shock protein PspC (stress-responsive transcriptional regulator)